MIMDQRATEKCGKDLSGLTSLVKDSLGVQYLKESYAISHWDKKDEAVKDVRT